jgi:hypothetical protein
MANPPPKKRLGELLVEAGIIDETQLKAALGHQRQWGVRLGQAVVDLKLATEQDVVKVLAKRFGFEVARLDQVEAYAHQQAVGLVPRDFAVNHNVFPLSADTSTLSVAMSDPSNLAVIDELRFRSGRRLKVSIGGDQEIAAAIQAAYPSPDGGVEAIALDIDDGGAEGESVMGAFGGGSSEDFESFFGTDPVQPELPPAGEDDPFSAGPAAAPVTVPAAPSPAPAAARAAAPAHAGAQSAAVAQPAPAARGAPPAARTSAPVTRGAQASAPAPRPAPAAAASPVTAVAARPAAAAPAPAQPLRPMIGDLELEVPGRAPQPARAQPAAPSQAPQPAPQPRQPRPGAAAAAAAAAPARARAVAAPATPATRQAAPAAAAPAARSGPLSDFEEEMSTILGELEVPGGEGDPALSPGEQAVLAALERLAEGGRAEPETLKPTQTIAVLVRLLLRKGVITERELLDALRARDPD